MKGSEGSDEHSPSPLVSVSRSYLLLFSEFTSAKIQHFPVFPTHSPQKIAASTKKRRRAFVNSAPCYSVVSLPSVFPGVATLLVVFADAQLIVAKTLALHGIGQ
jgi:hypothetical protein